MSTHFSLGKLYYLIACCIGRVLQEHIAINMKPSPHHVLTECTIFGSWRSIGTRPSPDFSPQLRDAIWEYPKTRILHDTLRHHWSYQVVAKLTQLHVVRSEVYTLICTGSLRMQYAQTARGRKRYLAKWLTGWSQRILWFISVVKHQRLSGVQPPYNATQQESRFWV